MDKVSVMKCGDYETEKLCAVIEQQFCFLEQQGPLIKEGNTVVIKPNLIIKRKPDEATTTHPEFIGAIIRAVKRRGGKPVIAESPGGPYTKSLLRSVYTGTGMTEIAQREGAELNYDIGYGSVRTKSGKVVSAFEIIDPIRNADVIINAAKLKTHGQMIYSGAVKNMFGSVPGLMKPEFHCRFPEKEGFASMIVDLCETVRPTISFIDGIVGMEGNGPSGGEPKKLGLVFAAKNPYTLDVAACRFVGIEAKDIPILADAAERGLCEIDASKIDCIGDGADSQEVKFKLPQSVSIDFTAYLPKFLHKPVLNMMSPRPAIIKKTCVGCGKCAESCPAHTIKIENRKAKIDYSKCIKCFCCHEMCPKRAIKIKRFRFLRF